MKIWIYLSVILGVVVAPGHLARSAQPPVQPALPNYDQRQMRLTSLATVNAPQAAAGVLLSNRVSGLRFDKDAVTGTPRLLSAQRGFLTGARGSGKGLTSVGLAGVAVNDPHRIVKAFVNEHSALFGHDAQAFDSAEVKVDAITPHNGLHTVTWQQMLDQIPVYEGLFVSYRTKNEELVYVSDRFVPNLTQAAAALPNRSQLVSAPPVGAPEAIRRAAENLGEDFNLVTVQPVDAAPQGAEKRQNFTSNRLNGEADTQLLWLPMSGSQVQLCWQVLLTAKVRPETYLILVNAQTGGIVLRRCLTEYISDATYRVYTSDSPSPFSPGSLTPSTFQPPEVARTLVTLKALNTNASPNGWIDDGVNETRGNNVDAHLDRNADNQPDLPRPQGSPNRVFDFPLDLKQSPTAYGNAAVVNLFYWNNFMHDKLYELGFTEAFGNFQGVNFNRGGVGNDAVQADAQDGSGVNNANFSTPPDGRPGRMQMYTFDGPSPDRDGDLDAEVMCHEYTHGLSNRLLGGGVGISQWQPRGMGEGWSDFYGMSLLSEATDDPQGTYATGGYASREIAPGFLQNYYYGIRRYPYCTDLNKNPLTLKDIDPSQADTHAGVPVSPAMGGVPADEFHAMGEVWCVTLWDARANLIGKLGTVVGNTTMLQLVTDGLKLAPANATYLEARDGIILADEILTGGDNLLELWQGFAKRGMGFSATVPTADLTVGVHEAYDLPDYVFSGPTDGIFEIKTTPTSSSALFGGTTNTITVRVSDGVGVTNATITCTVNPGGALNFRNDGVAPDLTPNNAIYSASLVTPNVPTNLTLSMVISAPGKDTATNVVSYVIVPVPANDNFTNATKVPAAGAVYVTNNKRATLENNEPLHAGVVSVAASLWWNYTPATSSSVLIDTAGSGVNTIVAVYTNSTLSTLQPVISADDIGSRQQAFVQLDGHAGITYRIAVASFDTNNTGTIRLAVSPGGVPDTNAPSITVSSPLSGLTVTTNRITITGTAIDPDPNPSGLQEVQILVNSALAITVNSNGAGDTNTASLISTNWSRLVGLFEGLNIIEVKVKDVAGNVSPSVVLQATYRRLDPVNDFFVNATVLTGVSGTNSVNTLKATKEVGEPNHAGNPGGKSAWWRYQPPADGVLYLTTTNSSFDTLLGVYTGNSVNALTLIAENDDAPGITSGVSALAVAVRSNQVYQIAVDGFDAASGVVVLHYTLAPANVYRLTINTTTGGTASPTSLDVVSNDTVLITAVPNTGYSFDLWDGDVVSLANPVSVLVRKDQSLTAHFRPVVYTDGFETGNFSALSWTNTALIPWIIENTNVAAGNFAARAGVVGPNQTSSLFLGGTYRAGIGGFDYRVSSELGWDFLSFLVDGVQQQQWSGELGWATFSFPLTAGPHLMEWRYSKDPNNNFGFDTAFIDNINLPVVVGVNGSTPAQLKARRQSDGTLFIDLTGQQNQTYVLQASADLKVWQNISTNLVAGGTIHIADPASLTNPVRFYRAVATVP